MRNPVTMETLSSSQYVQESSYFVAETYKKPIEKMIVRNIFPFKLLCNPKRHGSGSTNMAKSRRSPSISSTT